MTNLIMITHELVTLEQINSKRIYSHLYNNGIATSELTIDYHFWSQFAFLQDEPDYTTSGQPCPNYSLSGNKKGEDGETGWMFVQQTKIIIKMQPKIFRLEISDNAINVNGGSEVNKVIAHLNTKYHVQWDILKVRSYGDPTNRARLFIVGTWRDITADTNLKDIRFEFPELQFWGISIPTI